MGRIVTTKMGGVSSAKKRNLDGSKRLVVVHKERFLIETELTYNNVLVGFELEKL